MHIHECSKEQQQIIMLLAKRRKGPTLWSPEFCARFWSKCPKAAGTHFPIFKLQAWCFWSHLLQTCPSPLFSLSSDSFLQHYFFLMLIFLFYTQSICVSQCAYPTIKLHCLLHLGLISALQFPSSTDPFYTPDLLSYVLLFVPCQFQFLSSDKPSCNLCLFPSYNFQVSGHISSTSWRMTGKILRPYSKLNIIPMLAPSKDFFLFAPLGLVQSKTTIQQSTRRQMPKTP